MLNYQRVNRIAPYCSLRPPNDYIVSLAFEGHLHPMQKFPITSSDVLPWNKAKVVFLAIYLIFGLIFHFVY